MQNPNVKYIKMPNGYFCLFYRENNTLFLRIYANAGWSAPQILADRTASAFSVCLHGEICYVLYSTMEGTLFMTSSKDFVNWDHRPIMGEIANSSKAKKFFMIPNEDTFHMIYHLPTESTGIDSLVYTAFRNGQWEKPYQIDRFMPFGKTIFLARRLSKEHIILYYRTSRNTWSAREMLLSPYAMGSLTPMIQAASNFVDISIVNDTERIHILYIVRGMFRTQVVYQYKQTTAISTPRILWEDVNCDNCLIFFENGKLLLMWTVNGQPLRCISETNGASFGAVERYTGNFPSQCIKGEFVGADSIELNATETYGDISKGFTPFLLTGRAPERAPVQTLFYEKENSPQPFPFQQGEWSRSFQQEPQPRSKPPQTAVPDVDFHKKQLEELTDLLAQRSDEIASVNARWKAQVSRLEADLAALRQENETLKQAQIVHQAQKRSPVHLQYVQPQQVKQALKKIQAGEYVALQAQENQHTNVTLAVNQAVPQADMEE
ncbi:MAG: hypothetical protein EOM28_00730 [Clostridia bacterium]|nr:hypothetical protein [Clostridia bacterium]